MELAAMMDRQLATVASLSSNQALKVATSL